jgi:hypothetical protein
MSEQEAGLRHAVASAVTRDVNLISSGYLALDSRDVAASVVIALEAWIYDNVT